MSTESIVWITFTSMVLMLVCVWHAFGAIADEEPLRAFAVSMLFAWAVWGLRLTLQ